MRRRPSARAVRGQPSVSRRGATYGAARGPPTGSARRPRASAHRSRSPAGGAIILLINAPPVRCSALLAGFVAPFRLLKLPPWSRLIWAHTPRTDLCLEIVLAPYCGTGQTPQHRQLPNVRECVGYRPLKEPCPRTPQGARPGKMFVKHAKRGEETLHITVPRARRGIAPYLLSPNQRQSPLEKITYVSQDFRGRAAGAANLERAEAWRRPSQHLSASVGQGRKAVAQVVARIHLQVFIHLYRP